MLNSLFLCLPVIRQSLFAIYRSLIASHYSLLFLAREEPRPPILSTDSKSVAKVTKPAKAG